MNDLFTGHEAEMMADAQASYTPEQSALSRIESAMAYLQPTPFLDFLEPPDETARESAIRNLEKALEILKNG